jgi:TonB family protein
MKIYWFNLAAWCIQVVIVAAAGAALPVLFRVKAPRAKLWYWQALLAVCLALPLVEPWAKPVAVRSGVTFTTGQFHVAAQQAQSGFSVPWLEVGLAVLIGGIALRLLWLGAGLFRLRRYHNGGVVLGAGENDFEDLRRGIAPEAEILFSDQVTSPVTFGMWNAVILLPESFRRLGLEARRSIVCHELIHVKRRDWGVAIAEEVVRSLAWFHPAVWWLLGQIQLTREQVVDDAVIQHTGDRNRYLDALLAIASLKLNADLAPAPLFLKKRHLRQRVESIVSGVTMTKRNLLFPLAAALATLPVVIGIAAWQFPLRAATEATDDPGVEVQLGGAKILHRTGVIYPDDVRAKHIYGTVLANVTVDDKGEVADVKIASGPAPLGKAVLQSVMNWHFELNSPNDPRTFQIGVRFDGGEATQVAGSTPATPRKGFNPMTPMTIDSIDLGRLPAALRDKVAQANVVQVGGVISKGTDIEAMETALRQIDDHLRLGISKGETEGDSKARVSVFLAMPRTMAAGSTPTAIRVGGNVQSANLVSQVRPAYPPDAKQARIQGTVKFDVVIGKDGHVQNIQLVSGHPMLAQAAMDAVKQWVYKPTLLNGNPVDVITVVDVNFTLSQ